MKLLRLSVMLLLATTVIRSGAFVSGAANCPSSGNVQVSTNNTPLYQLTISAPAGNTGVVHVGGPTVSNTTGGVLPAGYSYNANKPNAGLTASSLYFSCTVSSDTISWIGSQ